MRLIAFYLPQFHPIAENDLWWGKGFTEWTNVTRAVSRFPGHEQPSLPADLGFYDLRLPEARQAQAELARAYGIHGFCYHHYWFSGRRLLERPFEDVLASGQPDFPFCVCWANENWTRRWDGQERQILIRQEYSDHDDVQFIHDLAPALRDERYIRVDGRPLIIVYYSAAMPHPSRSTATWRHQAREVLGLGDLYLVRAETHEVGGQTDPRWLGFDAAVEFPPHGLSFAENRYDGARGDFAGHVVDYGKAARASAARPAPDYPLHRGVMPGWDNTPRRKERGTVFSGSSPALYEQWLAAAVDWTRVHHGGEGQLLFVNAWNEWAEGAHLEPDLRWGHAYLEATARALGLPVLARAAEPPVPAEEPDPPAAELLTYERIAEIPVRTIIAAHLNREEPPFRRARQGLFQLLRAARDAGRRLRS